MICYVYRSNRKNDTYLYIEKEGDFSCLPETVLKIFGTPEFSLSFDLHPGKKLSQADATEVIKQLKAEGFYLQLPKSHFDIEHIEQQIVESMTSDSK